MQNDTFAKPTRNRELYCHRLFFHFILAGLGIQKQSNDLFSMVDNGTAQEKDMCVNEMQDNGTVRMQEEVAKLDDFKYLGSTVQSN